MEGRAKAGDAAGGATNVFGSTKASFFVCNIFFFFFFFFFYLDPNSPPNMDTIGANNAPKNPPLCIIFLFFFMLTFFDANSLSDRFF
jgi:hypothetical protein